MSFLVSILALPLRKRQSTHSSVLTQNYIRVEFFKKEKEKENKSYKIKNR